MHETTAASWRHYFQTRFSYFKGEYRIVFEQNRFC